MSGSLEESVSKQLLIFGTGGGRRKTGEEVFRFSDVSGPISKMKVGERTTHSGMVVVRSEGDEDREVIRIEFGIH